MDRGLLTTLANQDQRIARLTELVKAGDEANRLLRRILAIVERTLESAKSLAEARLVILTNLVGAMGTPGERKVLESAVRYLERQRKTDEERAERDRGTG